VGDEAESARHTADNRDFTQYMEGTEACDCVDWQPLFDAHHAAYVSRQLKNGVTAAAISVGERSCVEAVIRLTLASGMIAAGASAVCGAVSAAKMMVGIVAFAASSLGTIPSPTMA
jgi:hypothetical protein